MQILTPEERLGGCLAGRYRLHSVLSSRGMGVLFHATDEATNAAVVVKMLKPADALEKERVDRFRREARLAAVLAHPNVVQVFEVGADESGVPFLVMELLRGRSLDDELGEQGTLPFGEVLDVVLPIARALACAHAAGIIHRDVKPANIFLSTDRTGALTPKLLDFGIARGSRNDFETCTGIVLGTPGYMAPEQAMGGECGAFTDIWGLGAVLYRCLTGHPPHPGDSVQHVLTKVIREPVPGLVASGVGKSASAIIDRALERDPHDRYPNMEAFVVALSSVAGLGSPNGTTDEMIAIQDTWDGATAVPGKSAPRAAPAPYSVARTTESSRVLSVAALLLFGGLASAWKLAFRATAGNMRTPVAVASHPRSTTPTPSVALPSFTSAPREPVRTTESGLQMLARPARIGPGPKAARAGEHPAAAMTTAASQTASPRDALPSLRPPSDVDPGSGLPFATEW